MPPVLIGVALGVVGTLALEVGGIATVLWLLGRPYVPKRGVRS